jgi:hypothetical protein
MGRVSRCNGVSTKPHIYGAQALRIFDELVPVVRMEFAVDAGNPDRFQGEIMLGSRYENDTDVLLTLRSAATEAQFLAEPLTWVYDALQDCAERDWYYKHEKDWADRNERAEA